MHRVLAKHAWIIVVVVLVVGVFFLRLYRLPEYLMFLSDQGRDAIVLRRIVTLEKFVFVGPTTSIGNVFTGPFYYYLVAPFMLLAGLHPVGPAIGVALINSAGLVGVAIYLMRRFDRIVGAVFLILAGLSATQIIHSRYSWNPNPVPIFTFATLLVWSHAVRRRTILPALCAGILFGLSVQLHYISFVLIVPIVTMVLLVMSQYARHSRHTIYTVFHNVIKPLGVLSLGFASTFATVILFEIKNQFVNTHTLLRAFQTGEVQAKNSLFLDRLKDTCQGLIQHVFLVEVNRDVAQLILLMSAVIVLFVILKERRPVALFVGGCVLTIATNIFALAMLETGRHVHYYGPSYFPVYFILAYVASSAFRAVKVIFLRCQTYDSVGMLCDEVTSESAHPAPHHVLHRCEKCERGQAPPIFQIERAVRVCLMMLCVIVLLSYSLAQIRAQYFLTDPPRTSTQLSRAQNVAQYIISEKSSDLYQVVGLPFYETEGHYRYFLEYYGARPMPADVLGDPRELFVICHELDKPDCDIPGNPQWQIADFQNRHPEWSIASVKKVEDVRVFKLVY